MEANALLDAYRPVQHAVAFVELYLCANEYDSRDIFSEVIGHGWSPDRATAFIRSFADDEIESNDHGDMEALRRARAEMDRPEFGQYVAGKMGAV